MKTNIAILVNLCGLEIPRTGDMPSTALYSLADAIRQGRPQWTVEADAANGVITIHPGAASAQS